MSEAYALEREQWVPSPLQDVFAFFVLILVLIFRPSGLLGEKVADRA